MRGMWKRSYGRATKAPPDERGGNRHARPTATAPHPDSTHVVSRDAGQGVWRGEHHRIVYALTDIPGTVRRDDAHVEKLSLVRDNLSFTPIGVADRCTYSVPIRFIKIQQSPDIYDKLISDMVRGGAVHLEPRAAFSDPLVSQIVLTIANEIEGGFLDYILADALNTALAAQITRRFVDPSAITLAPSNGLSRERLQRVLDYIEAHLDDGLTLTDLAGVACLSPYHFSRSFKLAVGVGPQRYVMRRRLDRAKTLLRRSRKPLAVIAQEAGFADQSHLSSIFRREMGVTPGRFRAALA
jgi:AraC family transcriptional regulator